MRLAAAGGRLRSVAQRVNPMRGMPATRLGTERWMLKVGLKKGSFVACILTNLPRCFTLGAPRRLGNDG